MVNRTYTERDQLAQIDYNGDMVATYTHDSSGRRTTRTLGDTLGTHTQWQYTRADNLTTAIQSDIPGASFTYTYDANKNKLTETISAPMTDYGYTSTSYDPSDRLTAWNRADANLNQSWALSQVGDWNAFTETGSTPSTETRTHTSVHELTQINTTPLTHDAKGNLTQNSNTHTYTWDFDNRLTSATVGPNTHTYTYDALGRRVSKTIVDGPTSITTVFVCITQPIKHSPHAGQVVVEYLSNTAPTSAERKYVYATYIDEPVLMIDRTNAGLVGVGINEKFYYHQNNLYSVESLTDQSGAVQERYAYTAYGKPVILDATMQSLTTSSIRNDYTYTGRRYEFETELYYYRARHFDSRLGRFVSRDPIGFDGSEWNLYEYISARPLISGDPAGLWDFFPPMTGGPDVITDFFYRKYPESGCKCGECQCGTDITKPLSKVSANLWKAIKALHDTDKWKQINGACDDMTSFPTLAYSWDIYDLHDAGAAGKPGSDAFISGGCGKGCCAGTVTVNGKCYWAAEVNYYLFGLARAACAHYLRLEHPEGLDEHPYLTGAKAAVRGWRLQKAHRCITDKYGKPPSRRGAGMGIAGRIAWLEAGWYEDFSKAKSSAVTGCDICPSAYSGNLSGYIGGFTDRIFF